MGSSFKGVMIGGKPVLKPGAYTIVNADAMVPVRQGPLNTIAVIATAKGGTPHSILEFSTPQEAKAVLREGTLLDLINLAYAPGEVGGASKILAYRLNAAVQSALALNASAAPVINLTSVDYGTWTTQIRAKIEVGTVSGKKISINDVADPSTVESGDNLGKACTVNYVGAKFASQIVIVKTGDSATSLKLQTKLAGAGDPWVDELSLDLTNAQVSNLGGLVDYIDSLADYTCAIIGDPTMPSAYLDATVGSDIKTAPYDHTASIGAIVHWVNTHSLLVTASRQAAAVSAPDNVAYTFLSGGGEGGAVQNSDWQTALDSLLSEDAHYILVGSENATVHAMAVAHCEDASGVVNRKERRCFLGGLVGETVDQVVTRASAIGSRRAQLCYPGVKRRNLTTGNVDTLSPMYAAAICCGMKAGLRPEESLTFKSFRAEGLEKNLTLTEVETCLDKGITPLEAVKEDGIYRVVQDITCYLQDNNVIWRKGFGIDIADYLAVEIRKAVQRFVGRVGDRQTLASILNAAKARLSKEVRSVRNQTGVLTTGVDDNGVEIPAFENLSATFDGFDLVALTVEVHPVGEVSYLVTTINLTPTKIVLNG